MCYPAWKFRGIPSLAFSPYALRKRQSKLLEDPGAGNTAQPSTSASPTLHYSFLHTVAAGKYYITIHINAHHPFSGNTRSFTPTPTMLPDTDTLVQAQPPQNAKPRTLSGSTDGSTGVYSGAAAVAMSDHKETLKADAQPHQDGGTIELAIGWPSNSIPWL